MMDAVRLVKKCAVAHSARRFLVFVLIVRILSSGSEVFK